MDLALPSDVPLADLLPVLLRHAGDDGANEPAGDGWALSRLGGPPLDAGRSPAQLEIRDGELLYLAPRGRSAPEVVFDDVVDAVATATKERAGGWTAATTRRFSTTFAAVALLGGAAAVLFAGPPQAPGGLVGIGAGFVLLIAAALLSRLGADSRAGALFGSVALGYGGIGGLLLLAGSRRLADLGAPDVLLAATVLVVYAGVATVAVGDYSPLFVGALVIGVIVGVGAGVCLVFDAPPAGAAATIGVIALGTVPALPLLSYRLARLPLPAIPTGPEDLRSDVDNIDGRRVLRLSEQAAAFLTGLVGTVAVVVFGAVVVLVIDGGWRGLLLCAVLALLLLLRARNYLARAQRLAMLGAGSAALGAVVIAAFLATDLAGRLGLVLGGLVAVAALTLWYGLGLAGKRLSPIWGRLLDIVDIVLIVTVVPLAAWIAGVYGWIATIGR
jgi:type VII secretion integral membrane protein EccD